MEDKNYEFTCPYCQAKLLAQKSLFHHMGLYQHGGGNCLKCGKHVNLTYNPNTDTMIPMKWEDFVAKLEKEKGVQNERS